MLATATPPPITENDAARTRAELDHIVDVRRRFGLDITALRRELTDLRTSSGERVLERMIAGDGDELARQLGAKGAALALRLEMLESAEEAAIAAQADAILRVNRADAEVLQRRVDELRAEADARQPKSDELLAALKAWEGVDYLPPQMPNLPGELKAQGGSPWIVEIPTPKTDLLRIEAAKLGQQAAQLLERRVTRGGFVSLQKLAGTDAREVAAEMLDQVTADPMAVTPRCSEVLRWVEAEVAKQEARRAKLPRHQAEYGYPFIYELRWEDGKIADDSRSRRAQVTRENTKTGEKVFG